MIQKIEGFVTITRSLINEMSARHKGAKRVSNAVVKLSIFPCVWEFFLREKVWTNDCINYACQWSAEMKSDDLVLLTDSHIILDEYQKFEKNTLENWDVFKEAYLKAFPDADIMELEKPPEIEKVKTETKKSQRKPRITIDANLIKAIAEKAEQNPALTNTDLEKIFELGEGTIKKNKKLTLAIKRSRGTEFRGCDKSGEESFYRK